VTYNSSLDKIVFGSSGPFQINDGNKSINKVLGLDKSVVYNSDVANNITPPYRINLTDNRYIVLSMEQVSLNNSSTSSIHKSFALLNTNMLQLNYINSATKIIKYLNPPIARLTKIRISFTDYYGNLYDFQNHDHRIELVFESRKHLSRFT
jgi:hypothetical protein